MNKENFPTWQCLVRLSLSRVGYFSLYYLDNEYIEIPRCMTIEKIKEKWEKNQMMIDLESSLSYGKFDDVKECTTTKNMWVMLAQIHGGDKNVLRAKNKV